jgi:DNA-binding MarR family transcriptional regulator
MKSDKDVRRLTRAILASGNALLREAGRLFRPYNISAVQFNVLTLLAEAPAGLRPSELAAALVVDASSTTYVVDRMTAFGWLRRMDDRSDRRAWRIVLTPQGTKIHAEIAPVYLAALRAMLRSLDGTDLANLCESLEAVPQAARSAVDAVLATGSGKIKGRR